MRAWSECGGMAGVGDGDVTAGVNEDLGRVGDTVSSTRGGTTGSNGDESHSKEGGGVKDGDGIECSCRMVLELRG
jgi:hypothetical protein